MTSRMFNCIFTLKLYLKFSCNGQQVEKVGKRAKQKLEYLANEENFLDEIKSIFHNSLNDFCLLSTGKEWA